MAKTPECEVAATASRTPERKRRLARLRPADSDGRLLAPLARRRLGVSGGGDGVRQGLLIWLAFLRSARTCPQTYPQKRRSYARRRQRRGYHDRAHLDSAVWAIAFWRGKE